VTASPCFNAYLAKFGTRDRAIFTKPHPAAQLSRQKSGIPGARQAPLFWRKLLPIPQPRPIHKQSRERRCRAVALNRNCSASASLSSWFCCRPSSLPLINHLNFQKKIPTSGSEFRSVRPKSPAQANLT